MAPPQASSAPRHSSPKTKGNGRGLDQLKKLSPHVGKELTSEDLAKIVGAKGATGLGPKIRQLRANLEKDSILLDDYIEKREKLDATTPTMWMIKAAA